MESLEKVLSLINSYVWGLPLIVLLAGTHVFLTFRLGFIQRHIGKAIKISFKKSSEGSGDISHFASLMTALAATIGTGNIIGVATAISLGGPGAVFWMWMCGVFGIATKYSEALLSVKYRLENSRGEMAGGPMYALEHGLKSKTLGVFFALATALAAFGIGNMVQANSISDMLAASWGIPRFVSGAVITVLTAVVILGGVRSISRACSALVPVMAIGYIVGCLVLLVININLLPGAILLILKSAFTGHAAVGGFAGAGAAAALRFGVARGLFSNESGLGSAPIVAAAAQTTNPVRQALVSATGTFWDTVVVCLLTGLVLVSSGTWSAEGATATTLTKNAFAQMGWFGPMLLSFGLLTFVYSTILGWSYYGEKAIEYLCGVKAIRYYRWAWVAAVMAGANLTLATVWSLSDIMNALMAIPNLIALLALSGVIAAETRRYLPAELEKEHGAEGEPEQA